MRVAKVELTHRPAVLALVIGSGEKRLGLRFRKGMKEAGPKGKTMYSDA
jgi:hypothetical protein